MYPLQEFVNNMYIHLLEKEINGSKCNILKKHTEKLDEVGEFSFPLNNNVWKCVLKKKTINSDNDNSNDICIIDLKKKVKNLIEISECWLIPIYSTEILENRCNIFLHRQKIFKKTLKNILDNEANYGFLNDREEIIIRITKEFISTDINVTEHRLNLIYQTINNLAKLSNFTVHNLPGENCNVSIHLGTKSNFKGIESDYKIICGIAYDPKFKGTKASLLSADEYINKRSIDMQLMAQHKYGLRVKSEKIFLDLIEKLGNAAVTVDLLEVKHSSQVGLNTLVGHSSSKGASFILYNSARLETLFRTFEKQVEDGYYPKLPDFNEIDLTLLKEEEEWQLYFNFVLGFPNIIENSIGDLQHGNISLHLLCNFLNRLVGLFSIYYRRVRILTEHREQLLPVMFSRLYLLKAVRLILNKTLQILNIEPVIQM